MGLTIARFDLLRSQKYFRVTLERIAMGNQWKAKQKKSWEDKGKAHVRKVLQRMDRAPDQLHEHTGVEAHLKIMKLRTI
jgi:hypothetical protein